MDKQTPVQAARYVIDNWKALTGRPKKDMHREGDFPQEVYDYLSQHDVDESEFNDAFVELLG